MKLFLIINLFMLAKCEIGHLVRHSRNSWKKQLIITDEINSIRSHEVGSRASTLKRNGTIIHSQRGSEAVLRCTLGADIDHKVTWLKVDEGQLLTAGLHVYSSAKRYAVNHDKEHNVWELHIKDVGEEDGGIYECQLTSHPPESKFFTLQVLEAKAWIDGEQDLHVHEGSEVELVCRVQDATAEPQFIFWFHNESMVNFEGSRRPLKVTKRPFRSALRIQRAALTDAGRYRCEPSDAIPANVTLHVIVDKKSATMQRGLGKYNVSLTYNSMTSSSSCGLSHCWLQFLTNTLVLYLLSNASNRIVLLFNEMKIRQELIFS